jgi:hypothetical protein
MRKETAAHCPPTSIVMPASTPRGGWEVRGSAPHAGRQRRQAGVERTFIVA